MLENVSRMDGPILVHVMTKKGKGYPAGGERAGPLITVSVPSIRQTGDCAKARRRSASYTEVFGETLV